jgi:hypothetical protein
MQRHCDGSDPNLLRPTEHDADQLPYRPCDCGLRFDDAERLVIWPHPRLLTRAEKAKRIAQLVDAGIAPASWLDAWQAVPSDDKPAPPLDPDPDLIDHLEGNKRARRRYQEHARRMRAERDDPGRA